MIARTLARQRLAEIFDAAAHGQFPASDGKITVLPQPSDRDAGVVSFTAHSVVFADADPAWITSQLPAGSLSGPLSPRFLAALADRTGRRVGSVDLLACAPALPGPPPVDLAEDADPCHPRIQRALRYRDDIRAWRLAARGTQPAGGVVLLGRGPGGRWEVSVEVEPQYRSRGLGRDLVLAARHLVPEQQPLWAQIAPGNAASVRAFLAAGFRPAGAESLLTC